MSSQITFEGFRMAGADIELPYRYRLWRDWRPHGPRVLWVMLNPSTADGTEDDPTIRRCIGFSKSWGYAGLVVVNLFALRATDPDDLAVHEDPIGPRNDEAIRAAAKESPLIMVAWGSFAGLRRRDERVLEILRQEAGDDLCCLGLTTAGYPRHPLYVPGDRRPLKLGEVST